MTARNQLRYQIELKPRATMSKSKQKHTPCWVSGIKHKRLAPTQSNTATTTQPASQSVSFRFRPSTWSAWWARKCILKRRHIDLMVTSGTCKCWYNESLSETFLEIEDIAIVRLQRGKWGLQRAEFQTGIIIGATLHQVRSPTRQQTRVRIKASTSKREYQQTRVRVPTN